MPERNERSDGIGRRNYLQALGATGTLGLVALAGCTEDSSDGGGDGGDGGGGDGGDGGGDGGGGGGSNAISLGHLSPFSGGLGWIGPNSRKGVDVAEQEIADAGGILGNEVTITEADSETDPQSAVTGFRNLESNGVTSIIGPSSTVMPNLVTPAQDAKIPIVSTMSGTLQLDDIGGKWIWRTVPSDSIAGRAQGRYALDEGYEKMALVYKDDKGSQSFSVAAGNYFSSQGGEIVEKVALAPNSDSYRSEVEKVMNSGADVVSMTAAVEVSSLFVKNWRELGGEADVFLGNDVITPDFVSKVGAEAANGLFGQAPAPGPAYDAFESKHQEMHGEAPGAFSASSYDALNLIGLAMEKAGEVSKSAVANNIGPVARPPGTEVTTFAEGRDVLENGEEINYTGAANPQDFDDQGDPLGPFSVLQVQEGEWTELKTFSADELSK